MKKNQKVNQIIQNLRTELKTGKLRTTKRVLRPEEIAQKQRRLDALILQREPRRHATAPPLMPEKRFKNKCGRLRWQIKNRRIHFDSTTSLSPERLAQLQAQLEALQAAGPQAFAEEAPSAAVQPEAPAEAAEPPLQELLDTHEDLYIMQNSRIPGEIKIGRSNNVPRRKKDLEQAQNFKMNVLTIFPGKGYLEKEVHKRLKDFQVTGCAGTEWFKCSFGEAVQAIDQVIRCS